MDASGSGGGGTFSSDWNQAEQRGKTQWAGWMAGEPGHSVATCLPTCLQLLFEPASFLLFPSFFLSNKKNGEFGPNHHVRI